LVIQERGKNGVPGEKPSEQGENQQLNALVPPGENDLEPVSHWQFSNEQIPVNDLQHIIAKHQARQDNHPFSEAACQQPSAPPDLLRPPSPGPSAAPPHQAEQQEDSTPTDTDLIPVSVSSEPRPQRARRPPVYLQEYILD
jgi:hypothetical protein